MLTARIGFAVMVTGTLVVGLPVTQLSDEVNSQITMSLLIGVYVNEELLVPALLPLTFHKYAGNRPPWLETAINVTWLPGQKGFAEGVIETATAGFGVTVMVTGGLMAGLPVTQLSEEVSWQVTASPFVGT